MKLVTSSGWSDVCGGVDVTAAHFCAAYNHKQLYAPIMEESHQLVFTISGQTVNHQIIPGFDYYYFW